MAKYNIPVTDNGNLGNYIRKAETDFTSGTTKFSKYVDFSLYEDINRVYAYLESKHTSGEFDSQEREKPFFNIVLAARNIWYRATDIDRSNIKIRATKIADDIGVLLATIHLQDWMRRENFGMFLNSWGLNSSGFNESIVKFIEQGGRLIPSIVSWNRVICDSINFDDNPKIEILELTEAQLYQNKSYNPDIIKALCTARSARELVNKEKQDNRTDYIKLYEIHGVFPKSYLTYDDNDKDTYIQQMHVVSFVAAAEQGNYEDFTLFAGPEAKDPYMLTALIPEIDGSIALRGAVKILFDAQWMENHTVKSIKDQLDLASKIILQTADDTFIGQNALSAIQNGDIMIHKVNMPLTLVSNEKSNNTTTLQNFGAMWKSLGNEITGISESMLGQTPPSGQAWRQTQALLQENHSLFELMTENKGLFVEQMLRRFVIPFLKKKMNNSKEIGATLAAYNIDQIDAKYIKNVSITKANKAVKELLLSGKHVTASDHQQLNDYFANQTQTEMQGQGNQRFFKPSDIPNKTWAELFKDLEWEVECDITNENVDKDAMSTLSTLFDKIGANPNILQNPNARMIFNKILELTGTVSPLEIAELPPIPRQPTTFRVTESITYKDAPPDVQRQMEMQAGLQPSQMTPTQPQATPPIPAPVPGVGGGVPVGK